MADRSGIEWTDATWNPVTGCTKVSPGCDNCYAETFAERFRGVAGHHFEQGFDLVLRPERLDQPLRWTRPRRIFVNSMSDLFHDSVPDEFIAEVFAVMALASQHQFQVLTKRHGRMRSLLRDDEFRAAVTLAIIYHTVHEDRDDAHLTGAPGDWWPLANVWLGVSVETQQWADIRIPALLDTPAAVRWISAEPLLGPVDLGAWLGPVDWPACWERHSPGDECSRCISPEWVVVGGESGPRARPMHPDWARQLRDQCTGAGVPFLFKQWGEYVTEDQSPEDITLPGVSHLLLGDDGPSVWKVGKKAAGRELDGRTWDQYPAAVPA